MTAHKRTRKDLEKRDEALYFNVFLLLQYCVVNFIMNILANSLIVVLQSDQAVSVLPAPLNFPPASSLSLNSLCNAEYMLAIGI